MYIFVRKIILTRFSIYINIIFIFHWEGQLVMHGLSLITHGIMLRNHGIYWAFHEKGSLQPSRDPPLQLTTSDFKSQLVVISHD